MAIYFESTDSVDGLADHILLMEGLAKSLRSSAVYAVHGPPDASLVVARHLENFSSCSDSSCFLDRTRRSGARILLKGTIRRTDEEYEIDVDYIDSDSKQETAYKRITTFAASVTDMMHASAHLIVEELGTRSVVAHANAACEGCASATIEEYPVEREFKCFDPAQRLIEGLPATGYLCGPHLGKYGFRGELSSACRGERGVFSGSLDETGSSCVYGASLYIMDSPPDSLDSQPVPVFCQGTVRIPSAVAVDISVRELTTAPSKSAARNKVVMTNRRLLKWRWDVTGREKVRGVEGDRSVHAELVALLDNKAHQRNVSSVLTDIFQTTWRHIAKATNLPKSRKCIAHPDD